MAVFSVKQNRQLYVANAYKNDSNSNYAYLEDTFKGFVDKWASSVK